MKAVILEIKNNNAAILTESGEIKNIEFNSDGYEIGDTFEFVETKEIFRKNYRTVRLRMLAAASLIFVVGLYSLYRYNYVVSYATVTIEGASVEYEINRKNQVISVKAINNEGDALVDALNNAGVKHKDIEEVIELTTELILEDNNYGNPEEINISITTKKSPDKLQDKLENVIDNKVEEYEAIHSEQQQQSKQPKDNEGFQDIPLPYENGQRQNEQQINEDAQPQNEPQINEDAQPQNEQQINEDAQPQNEQQINEGKQPQNEKQINEGEQYQNEGQQQKNLQPKQQIEQQKPPQNIYLPQQIEQPLQ